MLSSIGGKAERLISLSRPCYNLLCLMPETRTRALLSVGYGLFTGIFCWYLLRLFHLGGGDFTWAIRAAAALLARRNPYADPGQLYPLPAALFGLPFVHVRPEIAAGIFFGISTALLTFGITRNGLHHFLIFFAYPYWACLLSAQWIPLIMASTFFWWLAPAAIAKPQIGLPVAVSRGTRNGALACAAVILLSLLVMPHWPMLWFAETKEYIRYIPLLVIPGPLLLAALARYRDRNAWLLFLAACMPQRWFYDCFFLWLIPKTRRQIIFTAGISWIPGIWRWFYVPHVIAQVGRLSVLCFYLPMLLVLFWQQSPPNIPQNRKAQLQRDSDATAAAPRTSTKD